jgi:pyruvate,water dikinase
MTTTRVSTASRSLFFLHELAGHPELAGSKAANLFDAANRGLTIPDTAVIPATVYNELVPGDGCSVEDIRARIASIELTSVVRDVVAALRDRFGDIRFAVRSSSNMEDGADLSFAGQYESFLDVPLDGMEDAIRGCWLSLWSDTALTYRGDTARPSMAVIIQPFLRGRLGGVAFSADPVSGNPFRIVIDYVGGDASGVTDGSVSTQVVTLTLDQVMLRGAAEPFQSIAQACLKFDRPVDLEWTWNEGHLSILQVRPITGVRRFAPQSHELARYCLPIREPLSRLGTSLEFAKNAIYQKMVRGLSAPRFRSKMLIVYGRLYLFEEEPGTSSKWRQAAGLLFSMGHAFLYLPKRRVLRRRIERKGSARESLVAAIRRYLSFYRTSSYAGYLYNNGTGLLVSYLSALTSGTYHRPLLYSLLFCHRSVTVRRDKGLYDLSLLLTKTNDSDWLPRQSQKFRMAYDRYCEEFGYVFADTNPRDPDFRVDHALAYSLLEGRQKEDTINGGRKWEEEVFTTIRARRFGRAHLTVFRLLRFFYRHTIGLVKEDRNHIFYLASARIREFVDREAAALCEELSLSGKDDLFFMTLEEISSGRGSAALRAYRRRVHGLSREFVDPANGAGTETASHVGPVLAGIPCSPGIVRGPIVFLRSRQDFAKATSGSIIVTDNLRPFWTPVLASARGLLCSTGNVLSHGASVAREKGVPAVLGLGEAVFSLREGETVTVDGLTGQVHREVPQNGTSNC